MNRKSESEENLDDMDVVPQGGPNKDDSLSELGQMCMRTEVSKLTSLAVWRATKALVNLLFFIFCLQLNRTIDPDLYPYRYRHIYKKY